MVVVVFAIRYAKLDDNNVIVIDCGYSDGWLVCINCSDSCLDVPMYNGVLVDVDDTNTV